jgi:hypothetical protein
VVLHGLHQHLSLLLTAGHHQPASTANAWVALISIACGKAEGRTCLV